MLDPLADVVISVTTAIGVVTGVLAYLRRDTPPWLYYSVIGAALLAAAQAVVAVGLTIAGPRPTETATFLGYALSTLLILPAALLWSRAEPGRWGNGVLCVGALTLAVMVVRMNQVWAVGGA